MEFAPMNHALPSTVLLQPLASRPAERIRPFAAQDAQAVAALYERVERSGSQRAAPGLVDCFRRFFADSPGVDPDIPSLVYLDDRGQVAGFLGVYVRRMRWDGRPLRMACSGQLFTAPHVRTQAAGARLLRRFLDGPQDLSITDGATDEARRLWQALGGSTAVLHCLRWTHVLRPARFATAYLARRRWARAAPVLLGPLAAATDVLLRRTLRRRPCRRTPWHTVELTAPLMAQSWPRLALRRRLHPDYDAAYLQWLLTEMRRSTARGTLRARLVEAADGQPLGWFLYYLNAQRIAEVVQLAAPDPHLPRVLDCLLHDADVHGALAVQGRVEPGMLATLDARACWLHYRAPFALVHSRDPAIAAAIHAGEAFLTRADGEWWTSFIDERFDPADA
jgi:hypothetical protein